MSDLVHRGRQALLELDWLLHAQIAGAQGNGSVAAARLQAGAFAASVALQNACMLSNTASAASKLSPGGTDVYKGIVLAYGTLAIAEIQALRTSA